MPFIDITYDEAVGEHVLRELAARLPDVVAEAVECAEEPGTGPPQPGDLEIRFRQKSRLDVSDLDLVIEVRTKAFASRRDDSERRANLIRDRMADLEVGGLGVWLILVEGAWSQS